MSSRTEPTRGSSAKRRPPEPAPAEDALANPGPPTDDTPTIISRNAAAGITADVDPARTVRGRQLAHFELIEAIGVGGMAAVLRARDTQLDRLVALKILPPEMAQDPENVRRFHQEARSAAKLDHENIARVFFCGEDQRLHFIAFEFVEGDNLRTILERRGRLPVGEALHYLIQVAAGLAHAAQRGVVHRDIKPSNIIIMPSGRAKLVDMGLARSLAPRSEDDLTQSGVTLGTFDYISPEQALEPRDADARSDIYSLGCTFYHMLTGQPPVPEGTAAKKLHHHQHVKPADPREYVPGLPIEVVQVLDRMIAKSPADRFQSPEHLLQALLAAARKVGVSGDGPDGLLTVEAPLPGRAPGRPLLWAAVAVGLVVVLTLLLDPMGQGTPGTSAPRSKGPDRTVRPGTKDKAPANPPKEGPRKAPDKVADDVVVITVTPGMDLADLATRLSRAKDAPHVELVLAGDLDLSSSDGERRRMMPLVVQASQSVTIRRDEKLKDLPTIRFVYNTDPTLPEKASAVTVIAPRSRVEGVRFVVDQTAAPARKFRGLHLVGGASHEVRRCLFVQARPFAEPQSLTSLLADAAGSNPDVKLTQCVFLGFDKAREVDVGNLYTGADLGGQDAVVCVGAVKLTGDNCAVGPHAAAFRLEGGIAKLTLSHSTVILPPRPAAALDLAGTAEVNVAHCLIARLPSTSDLGGVVLLRQARESKVQYRGDDNVYHDLDGYWAEGDDWQQAGWAAFRRGLEKGQGKDSDARLLAVSPWQSTPAQLVLALERQDPDGAFRIALDQGPLRQKGLRRMTEVVGVQELLGSSWVPVKLPEERSDPPGRRVLVVEPGYSDEVSNTVVYPTLDAALPRCQQGDTILLRHNGEMRINPVALNLKERGNLTIRPARRFRPVLKAAPTTDADALFRLYDGRLRLEGLELVVAPVNDEEGAQPGSYALVALIGDGECVLKGCTITLQKPADSEVPVVVATLNDPGKLMRMAGVIPVRKRELGPRLALENCLVRGDGDLLIGRATRPGGLELKNTLAALTGSLVQMEHINAGGGTMPPAAHKFTLVLDQATAYLGGPLVRLKVDKDPRGVVPIEAQVSSCLFLPANGVKSLIHLDGPEGEDKEMADRFVWRGTKNAYGKYAVMIAQRSGEEMAMMPDRWKERDTESVAAVLVEPLPSSPDLTRLTIADFRLKDTTAGARRP